MSNGQQEWYYRHEPPGEPPNRLPYLTFRVPGNKMSKARAEMIGKQILEHENKLGSTKEKQAKLWEECREELDKLESDPPMELKVVSDELREAILKKSEPGPEKKDNIKKLLSVIERRLKVDSAAFEKNELSLRESNKILESLQQHYDRSKARLKHLNYMYRDERADKEDSTGGEDSTDDDDSMDDDEASDNDESTDEEVEVLGGSEAVNGIKDRLDGEEVQEKGENEGEKEEVGEGGTEEGKEEDRKGGEEKTEEEKEENVGGEGEEGEDKEDENEGGKKKGVEDGVETEAGEVRNKEVRKKEVGEEREEGREEEEEVKKQTQPETPSPQKDGSDDEVQRRTKKKNISKRRSWSPYRQYLRGNIKSLKRESNGVRATIDQIEKELKVINAKIRGLEAEKKVLSQQLKTGQRENLNEVVKEQERLEQEQDKERKAELDGQHQRKKLLTEFRQILNNERNEIGERDDDYHLQRPDSPTQKGSPRLPDSNASKYYIDRVYMEDQLEERERALRKIEQLEGTFESVMNTKRESRELQDLINVLNREKHSEETIQKASKNPGQQIFKEQTGHQFNSPFKYSPLEDGHIRLLKIWYTPHEHYPLICSLKSRPLKSDGVAELPYDALSYFWGPESPGAYIYLRHDRDDKGIALGDQNWGSMARHARRVFLRANLYRALLQLRKQRVSLVWVDFLCINQTDTIEKTSQLREMVKIYGAANRVCVWLGEADDIGRSDKAMDFIEAVKDFAMLNMLVEDTRRANEWLAISELMRDRWFSRRWVVQEIALAKDATIYCGSKVVQWSDFVDAVSILVSNQSKIRELFDPKSWRDGPGTLGEVQYFGANILIEELSSLFWRAEDGTIIKPVKSLESLVTSLNTFDTSDERDLIYSLIFIASDTFQGSKTPKTGGYTRDLIDYEKSTADVYKDFVLICINTQRHNHGYPLDIICRPWAMPAKSREKSTKTVLPSWIALLSNSAFGEPEQIYKGRKNGETFVGSVGQPRYRASGDEVSKAEFEDIKMLEESGKSVDTSKDDDPSVDTSVEASESRISRNFPWSLAVKGFILAKVGKVSPKNTGGLILQESLQMGGWQGIENMSDTNVPEKIWRTLVANKDKEGRIPRTWYQRACLRCLEIADNFNGGDLNVGQILQGCSGMMRTYLTRVQSVIWNRSFFTAVLRRREGYSLSRVPTTENINGVQEQPVGPDQSSKENQHFILEDIYGDNEKGGYDQAVPAELFGLCPSATRAGDLVCIIYGCSVPVILREETADEPRYIVIGESYVHGKMDGEAIDGYKTGWSVGKELEFKLV
ncbi:hypothetical protein TWF788_009865 [Orbilia oligospora]|uniref:Heterokaryon incompatibility domain-containing protein n=1 Tax=Orbilia oligospora TaxID=2813651 RepID=A0A7C8UE23_ORBOL|nr:hypothetical protein TWF788_009865 [Orbilia oligospora]